MRAASLLPARSQATRNFHSERHYAADTFSFDNHFGAITVAGYLPGYDTIDFDHNDFLNVAAVEAHATQDTHGDTIITLGPNDTITLLGVTLNQFESHTADWHFI